LQSVHENDVLEGGNSILGTAFVKRQIMLRVIMCWIKGLPFGEGDPINVV
jgi:hypothetical protein